MSLDLDSLRAHRVFKQLEMVAFDLRDSDGLWIAQVRLYRRDRRVSVLASSGDPWIKPLGELHGFLEWEAWIRSHKRN